MEGGGAVLCSHKLKDHFQSHSGSCCCPSAALPSTLPPFELKRSQKEGLDDVCARLRVIDRERVGQWTDCI